MTMSPLRFRHRVKPLQTMVALVTLLGVCVTLFPIAWMVLASVRPTSETLSSPPVWVPRHFTLDAYRRLFSDDETLRYFANSYTIAGATAALSIGLGLLAAYGFSRFRIKGARLLLSLIFSMQMLPSVLLIIPFFDMSLALGIHNTRLALVLANSAFALPISLWMLKSYMDSIPVDLEEAAMIDGCTRVEALWRILLPLALPALIGTGTFAFLWAWNEFMFAVVLTSGPKAAPLTIAISLFFTRYGREWDSIMALNVIATLPLLAIFTLLQRWVVQGMTAGAIK